MASPVAQPLPDWEDDDIYAEAACDVDDVYYQGSEDEDYDNPATRRQRYEAAGQRFLDGHVPFLLSASLQGPFDPDAGWSNPWRSKRRVESRIARVSDSTANSAIHATGESADGPELSDSDLECHLPSPESLKQAPVTEKHLHLEDDELSAIQDWRKGVLVPVPSRDSFWAASKAQVTASAKRRRARESEWLRKVASKKQKLDFSQPSFSKSPLGHRTSAARGLRNNAPVATVSPGRWSLHASPTPRKCKSGKSAGSFVGSGTAEDELTTSPSGDSLGSARGLVPNTPKRVSPRRDMWKCVMQTTSLADDELSQNEAAAATLSSPVSQQGPMVAPGHRAAHAAKRPSMTYSAAQTPPVQLLDTREGNDGTTREDVDMLEQDDELPETMDEPGAAESSAHFQTQADQSFCFKIRHHPKHNDEKTAAAEVVEQADITECSGGTAALRPQEDHSQGSIGENPIGVLATKNLASIREPEHYPAQFHDLEAAPLHTAHEGGAPKPPVVCDEMGAINTVLGEERQPFATEGSPTHTTSSLPVDHADSESYAVNSPSIQKDMPGMAGSGEIVEPNQRSPLAATLEKPTIPKGHNAPSQGQLAPALTVQSSEFSFKSILHRLVPSSPWARLSQLASSAAIEDKTDDTAGVLPSDAIQDTDSGPHPSQTEQGDLGKDAEPQTKDACDDSRQSTPGSMSDSAGAVADTVALEVDNSLQLEHQAISRQGAAEAESPLNAVFDSSADQLAESAAAPGTSTALCITESQQSPWAKIQPSAQEILKDDPIENNLRLAEHVRPDTKEPETGIPPEAQSPWAVCEEALGTAENISSRRIDRYDSTKANKTQAMRLSTPEPQFSVKPFASFVTPSPERTRQRRGCAGEVIDNRRRVSALKNRWSVPRTSRRVSWRLPDEDAERDRFADCEEREHQSSPVHKSRTASPPPATPIGELPTLDSDRFRKHFAAVASRTDGLRQKLIPTASQEIAHSPGLQGMAIKFLATEDARPIEETSESGAEHGPDAGHCQAHQAHESQEPMDVVDDLFREMDDFLQVWDVDAELDQARRTGPVMQPITVGSQSPW
ncbi:choline oxidase [Purpureocillium lavendulum]|uniref:Choline oxidase n=1 Tax=Purpureocillium lavendulum TaxID=1247861 RepID=A0AB34FIW1_9HYPO|nr:choline oxidase [Purpureocillium lavendulum]